MSRFRNLEFEQPESSRDRSAEESTRDDRYYMSLADRECRQRYFENALRYYSRALEMNATLVPAWVGQVRMLIGLEEYPEAELWAGKALERFKEHPDLLAGRAQAACRLGNFEDAHGWSDKSVRATGESAYRWVARGDLMLATRGKMADYCFTKAAQADDDWLVSLEVGEIYLYHDQASKATPWFRKATEAAPDHAASWLLLARCQRRLRMTVPSRKSYEECLKLAPDHRDAHAELAELENERESRGLKGWLRRWFE